MGGRITKKSKAHFTTNMDTSLINEVRNCVAALVGTPHELRVSDFFDQAARAELRRQQDLANNGQTFPQRSEKHLKSGRPVSKRGRGQ